MLYWTLYFLDLNFILGASYDGIESELFGARVLIGNTPVGSEALIGNDIFVVIKISVTIKERIRMLCVNFWF